MKLADRIRLIPRVVRGDARGWLLKVIDGHEADLPDRTGEVYLTLAHPGQIRGNHYHAGTAEWFTVVQGAAEVRLVDPIGGETMHLVLRSSDPMTLFVPPGVAHAFLCPDAANESMLLVAYASKLYDASDTISWKLF